jgi:hypothetical protein
MTSNPSYIYEKLPEETIRVFVLAPGTHEGELRGHFSLQHVSQNVLSDRLPYEALSYTWGAPEFPQSISLNHAKIPITQNLFDALVRFRDAARPRAIWVDALCINQQDLNEKAKQINLMIYVYINASSVLVWLGIEDDSTRSAISLLRHAVQYFIDETKALGGRPSKMFERDYDDAANIERGFPSREQDGVDGFAPLISLLCRPWFTRVWIIQEVALAPEATLFIGNHEMPWTVFCGALDFLNRKKYAFMIDGRDIKKHLHLTTGPFSRRRLQWKGASFLSPRMHDLGGLLFATREFKATNSHDKVFALLNMAYSVDELLVDYGVSLKDLLTNVARHLFLHPGINPVTAPLRYLSEADHSGHNIDPEFPSWVPQWHVPRLTWEIDGATRYFKAGGKDGANILPIQSSDPYILQVGGFIVGMVDQAVQVNPLEEWSSEKAGWWDALLSIRNLATEWEAGYPTGEDYYDVFSKVLTANRISSTGKSYSGLDFQAYFHHGFVRTLMDLNAAGEDYFALLKQWSAECQQLPVLKEDYTPGRNFTGYVRRVTTRRKLFRTDRRLIGVGPQLMKQGDLACVLFGANVPYILRPIGNERFQFLGECYLQGVMYGESLEEGRKRSRIFQII